jgi:glucose/arabinose dehydrogenase
MRLFSLVIAAVTLAVTVAGEARAQLTSTVHATGFSSPIAFVQDPTDPAVQLVVQQGGRVRVVRNGVTLATDFLDLRNEVSTGGERGLLGLAFAPNYATSGRFFVNFTNTSGHTVIARFTRSTNPLVADPSSRFDLRWGGPGGPRFISQPYSNHNGGHLAFGPDGFLYIGLGDGGSGNDPEHRAQNPAELLGKMLRIDVNVPDGDATGYQVPPDNPFLDNVPIAALPEIWSFGLRNPWRYSFDDPARGGTGALVMGDVGQSTLEEINYEPSASGGRNYGWRNREGDVLNIASPPPAYQPLTDPIHSYNRSTGQSITGGYVYRGRLLGTAYQGRYFFADFVAGRVWSLRLTIDPSTREATASDRVDHTTALGSPGNISSFGVDAEGELYLVRYAGTIAKIAATPAAPVITAQPATTIAAGGASVSFSVAATGTPVPAYPWQISTNGGATWTDLTNTTPYAGVTTATLTITPASAAGNALYRSVITNSAGTVASIAAALVAPAPPFGSFDSPSNGAAVSGSIPVTGWALDNTAVTRVEIWRDLVAGETTPPFSGGGPGSGKVFIATAAFISGARPDVEAIYPTYPLASRAGWGYLLMTQGLWNQNGTFTLHAFAFDQEGNSATLGNKTIVVDNANATKPFGSIDTPGFGQTVTSSFWNYGWALTPNATPSCTIGPAGVQVAFDSGPLIPVSYGDLRSDVATYFPGLTNSNGSGGAYYVDTSSLSNGTHQIGWFVTDSCGRSEGIGSRFFTVNNGGARAPATAVTAASGSRAATPAAIAVADAAIEIRRGDEVTPVFPNAAGDRVVPIGEDERVEVHLPASPGRTYVGYQIVMGERRALPLGSSLDAAKGVFYWQPAAGFLGAHDLLFVPKGAGETGAAREHGLRVRAVVKTSVQAAIDSPPAGYVSSPFTVAGWAIDLGSREHTGIDTVHVWAYPASGARPIFAGVARYGDERPDIGATFGDQFSSSAFALAVDNLPPGTYDLAVYPHSAVTGDFHGAKVVRVTVR